MTPGARVGPYEVLAPLGEGGMGEVYRARDTRLDRTVAIKVLPASLAGDPEFQARFAREARTISSLEHPHICPLYDVGSEGDTSYLVMQYLEGETLAARLERGALALDQALKVAVEVAAALDHAHRHGIVHRDLKPGNVMLTPSGARLLDFGLAKPMPAVMAAASTRLDTPVTSAGTIVGTVQYMAPEQIEGREADARGDLFAFGAVLHEMLTGQPAFSAPTQAGLIGAILRDTPAPPSSLAPGVPPALDHLVTRCLAKDPEERWTSAHDLLLDLQWIRSSGPVARPLSAGARGRWQTHIAWAAAAAATAVIAGAAGWSLRVPSPDARPPSRFVLPPPEGVAWRGEGLGATISPDGRHVAVIATGEDKQLGIWLRRIDDTTWRKVEGALASGSASVSSSLPTGNTVFWSADSRLLLFVDGNQLKRVSVDGGQAAAIGSVPNPTDLGGGTANADGVVLLGYFSGPIHRISLGGGSATPLRPLDPARGEIAQMTPSFLPDGSHYLFVSRSAKWTTMVGTLESNDLTDLDADTYAPRYVSPGLMVFITPVAMVQRFDLRRLRPYGETRPMEPQSPPSGVSVSANGIAAYFTSGSQPQRRNWSYGEVTSDNARLAWLDRSGRELEAVTPAGGFMSPRLSPDERFLAVERFDNDREGDIWTYDVRRAVGSRLTVDPERDADAVWSPRGDRIAWTRNGSSGEALVLAQQVDSGTPPAVVKQFRRGEGSVFVADWSPDGRHLVLSQSVSFGRSRLEVLGLEGAAPIEWPTSAWNESQARCSPDGQWIAYVSDETGTPEVYVRAFRPAGAKLRVSPSGGYQPEWRRDGREIYFVAPDRTLTAVSVHPLDDHLEFGTPQPLFHAPIASPGEGRNHYEASADGRRFLVNIVKPGEAKPKELVVVLDWARATYDQMTSEATKP